MNIIQAMRDPKLFGPWFKNPDDWQAWRVFLATLFALPLDDAERAIFANCTARSVPPADPCKEAWLACGRRGGKSFIMALTAVYLATFRDYRPYLAPGERATVMLIATDRKQARVLVRYIGALLRDVPMLALMLERETAESFDLTNRVTIEVATASYRSIRGYTLAAAILDEIAFWPTDDAAEPDRAILDALRPAMATLPGAVLLAASSPYARRGALYDAHRRYFGNDGAPVLVWQAATRTMNPTVPQSIIDEAVERDPAWAAAEFMAQFRDDIAAFVSPEAIHACIEAGVHERPPERRHRYVAFVDPSGGSSDSMTIAVAHREADTGILDCIREVRPPFSPEAVVAEFAALSRRYRVSNALGDRYAGEWPVEQFRRHGIYFEQAARPKSDLYRDLLPAINAGAVDLLDNQRLTSQLASLERRTARGGRDSIDHPPGSHDDVANAAAGALVLAMARRPALDDDDWVPMPRVESAYNPMEW